MGGFDPMILESSLSYQKTLETTVLVARAQENPVAILPENGVHKNVVDAASGSMGITEIGGLEAAPYDLSHSTAHDATGKVGAGPEIQPAQEQGRTALMKSHGEGSLVIEPEHEGSDSGSPLKSPAGGTGGEAEGASGGEKKRKKRTENWADGETEILLEAVSSKTSSNSGFVQRWEGIAKDIQGRTGYECQMRMDTLTKSYNAIKKRYGNKRFSDEAEFRNMMLAMPKRPTRLKLNWYNTMCKFKQENEKAPRSNKKMRKVGAGSPSANGMDIVPSASASCELVPLCMESHNPEPESTEVVMTTPDEGHGSKPALEAFDEVVLPEAMPYQHPTSDMRHVATPDGPLAAVNRELHQPAPGDLVHNTWAVESGGPTLGEWHPHPNNLPRYSAVGTSTNILPLTDAECRLADSFFNFDAEGMIYVPL